MDSVSNICSWKVFAKIICIIMRWNSCQQNLSYLIWFIQWTEIYPEAATRGVLWKKGFYRNFTKFTGKYLWQSLFFFFIKKGALAQVFSCEFWEIFLRTPFLQNISGRLLPYIWSIGILVDVLIILCNDVITMSIARAKIFKQP